MNGETCVLGMYESYLSKPPYIKKQNHPNIKQRHSLLNTLYQLRIQTMSGTKSHPLTFVNMFLENRAIWQVYSSLVIMDEEFFSFMQYGPKPLPVISR